MFLMVYLRKGRSKIASHPLVTVTSHPRITLADSMIGRQLKGQKDAQSQATGILQGTATGI